MKAVNLAATRPANQVLHMVPVGNRHARCGVVAEHVIYMPTAVRSIGEGVHHLCKNCNRVTPARDTRPPVDPFLSELTDVWSVMDKAGKEFTRVYGTTLEGARNEALEVAEVRRVNYAEGGFSLRRLTMAQLRSVEAVDALEESAWSTMTLHTILHREFGFHLQGRRVICASLAARGVTPERVRELNV